MAESSESGDGEGALDSGGRRHPDADGEKVRRSELELDFSGVAGQNREVVPRKVFGYMIIGGTTI